MKIDAKLPAECKECGSSQLTWQNSVVNRSDVQQERLNIRDVECLFFLGCDECSETLMTISADKVAGLMNASAGVAAQSGETPAAKATPTTTPSPKPSTAYTRRN